MKIGFLYNEFQCPCCNIDIEDKNEQYLRRIIFKTIRQYIVVKCGNCGERFQLYWNDMDGKLVAYRIKK